MLSKEFYNTLYLMITICSKVSTLLKIEVYQGEVTENLVRAVFRDESLKKSSQRIQIS